MRKMKIIASVLLLLSGTVHATSKSLLFGGAALGVGYSVWSYFSTPNEIDPLLTKEVAELAEDEDILNDILKKEEKNLITVGTKSEGDLQSLIDDATEEENKKLEVSIKRLKLSKLDIEGSRFRRLRMISQAGKYEKEYEADIQYSKSLINATKTAKAILTDQQKNNFKLLEEHSSKLTSRNIQIALGLGISGLFLWQWSKK